MIDEYALVAAQQATRTAGPRRHLQSAPVPLEVLRAAITAYLSTRSAEPVAWMARDQMRAITHDELLNIPETNGRRQRCAGMYPIALYAHPKEAPDV